MGWLREVGRYAMSTPPLTEQRVHTEGTISDRRAWNWHRLPKGALVMAIMGLLSMLSVTLAMVSELRESRLARMDEDGREIRREVPALRQDVNDLKWRMQHHLTLDEEYRQERKEVRGILRRVEDEVLRLSLVDSIERGDSQGEKRVRAKMKAIEAKPNGNGESQ